ncbi:MAG: flippase-like domain-containing protein [Flammeovirgaceae bacterium]|nr:flippase-like domain-containing protein [Flammeovirgaceae bacterium]
MQYLKSILNYTLAIAIMIVLLWLSLRGLNSGSESKWELIWNAWLRADKFYLILMAVIMMFSHFLRAVRWQMLLKPTGNQITLTGSFLSVLIGYLVNLAIPRGGEVSRCYNLYKLDKAPIEISFGTVVTERIIDIILLLILVFTTFIIEWDKLSVFIATLPLGESDFIIPNWLLVAIIVLLLVGATIYILRKNKKVQVIIAGFKVGLISVFNLEKKGVFIIYSVVVWLLYFVMTYVVMMAFPETADLGVSAVTTIFAIGAIAMAIPLPGGAGSYHTLVPAGLVLFYNLPSVDAIAFVFVFHAWQTIILILGGVVSLIISYFIIRWRKT